MDAHEYKKKRAARVAAAKPAKEERDAKDREALDALEERLGIDGCAAITIPAAPPLPGVVVIKPPEPSDYRLWQAIMTKTTSTTPEKIEAHEEFARSVVLYPERDVYLELLEKYPGVSTTITGEAVKLAGAGLVQRGKE